MEEREKADFAEAAAINPFRTYEIECCQSNAVLAALEATQEFQSPWRYRSSYQSSSKKGYSDLPKWSLSFSEALLVLLLLVPAIALGQAANGKLQMHFMDVGQGDAALLVSPLGEIALFDDGPDHCDRVIAYLQGLGVTHVDYHIASHYHDDHIGCIVSVLSEFPPTKQAFDRGGTYSTKQFRVYTNFLGSLRKTAIKGEFLILDGNSPNPVRIDFVALNGNGAYDDNEKKPNENDLSLVCVVRFGQFDAVMGGDLSGIKDGGYEDIETSVAPLVRQVELYKVNHHGSQYSSNTNWLSIIKPKIGIISCGTSIYHHPTSNCLSRLHSAGIPTYWTEHGNGVNPAAGTDKIGGNIVVEVAANATTFTVTYAGDKVDTYEVWNPVGASSTATNFAWSKKAYFYHFTDCSYVKSISPGNLATGTTPPEGKTLHTGCPK